MIKTDLQLQEDIETELRCDPRVNAAEIGVRVENGAVSLFGAVGTFAAMWAAENATKRVSGVRAVAQELKVKILPAHVRTDTDIAATVGKALEWDVFVPDAVTARVRDGAVTLEGAVEWNYQRESAQLAIRDLVGVVAIYNEIEIKPRATATHAKENVEAALQRQATVDPKSTRVETQGASVTLRGHVPSWRSMTDALATAWRAPGVRYVVDRLKHRGPSVFQRRAVMLSEARHNGWKP